MEQFTHVLEVIGIAIGGAVIVIFIILFLLALWLKHKIVNLRKEYLGKRSFMGIVVIPLLSFLLEIFAGGDDTAPQHAPYLYQRKQWFMTKNEHDVFDAIQAAAGNEYYLFPQVKLDKIFDWKSNGKDSVYAMRHINQKSVDFLLCDKTYINPRLAIELDDSTHEREDRRERDSQVDRIFNSANFPLLRIHYSDIANQIELKEKILKSL